MSCMAGYPSGILPALPACPRLRVAGAGTPPSKARVFHPGSPLLRGRTERESYLFNSHRVSGSSSPSEAIVDQDGLPSLLQLGRAGSSARPPARDRFRRTTGCADGASLELPAHAGIDRGGAAELTVRGSIRPRKLAAELCVYRVQVVSSLSSIEKIPPVSSLRLRTMQVRLLTSVNLAS
jgi:hypothetical protein